MKAENACLACLWRRQEKRLEKFPDREKKDEYRIKLKTLVEEFRDKEPSPGLSERADDLFFEFFGEREDLSVLKSRYNRLLLEKENELRHRIRSAADPLTEALRLAAAANYVDLEAVEDLNEKALEDLLERADRMEIPPEEAKAFSEELQRAKNLAYLTDNCGEIVLDKLLIEFLKEKYPGLSVTVILRGGAVTNDATLEDAEEVGLPAVAHCIGNGNRAAGTVLGRLSAEAKTALSGADIILAKGQGNFESLYGEGLNPYYLFLCKCELFTHRFGMKRFSAVFGKEERMKKISEKGETMEKRPVIGIVPDYSEEKKQMELYSNYVTSVERSCGIPLVLPIPSDEKTAEKLAALCDGFLFSGGIDVSPKRYGEEPIPELGEVSPFRDDADFGYFRLAYESKKPIFGICRGEQVLNVCRGGTLYQDLPAQFSGALLNHRQEEAGDVKTHEVLALEGSITAKAYGTEKFAVNSFHHEAVRSVAPGLTVTAKAPDGVIEALEDKAYGFFVLVQWHPEKMFDVCKGSRELFHLFIEACR